LPRKKNSLEKEKKEKKVAREFFKFIMDGRPTDARYLFTRDCRHHNPYLRDGIDALLESIANVQKGESSDMPTDASFQIKYVIADGNVVAVYTTLESKSDKSKGMRQVHLFRFRGDRVSEYWDVTQMVPEKAPYPEKMY
jgi:predicted SnoaL-like aldol condensation-catalyzing enzyme